jgi:hypothetical protein
MALVWLAGEDITVTNADIGITTTLVVGGAQMATVQHRSGGVVYELPGKGTAGTPGASAGNGEMSRAVGTVWEIWGTEDMAHIRWEKKSGESDGVLAVNVFGSTS